MHPDKILQAASPGYDPGSRAAFVQQEKILVKKIGQSYKVPYPIFCVSYERIRIITDIPIITAVVIMA
tara:strand:+ start:383 stop:586 length:204 start_codon:yes stop_codon:yes gene_type:complete